MTAQGKKISIVIVMVFFTCTAMIGVLTWRAKNTLYTGGGFNRNFVSEIPLQPERMMELEDASYYIAGSSKSSVYLAHRYTSFDLLRLDLQCFETSNIRIRLDAPDTLKFRALQIRVDSPVFHVGDGIAPFYFRGDLSAGVARRIDIDNNYFIDYLPFDKTKLLLKSVWNSNETRLGIFDINSGHVRYFPNVLEKQADGVFCTDGLLHASMTDSIATYVYFYRNEFFSIRSKEQLEKRSYQTIDTTCMVKLETADFKNGSQRSYKGSPPYVNRKSTIAAGKLFIQSGLIADNESQKTGASNSVVDIYELKSGEYLYSLYLPKINGDALDDFTVNGDVIVALFGNRLMAFRIPAILQRPYM